MNVLVAIEAIDALIDIKYDGDEVMLSRFANYIRLVFTKHSSDPVTLSAAAKCLGHLVLVAGAWRARIC